MSEEFEDSKKEAEVDFEEPEEESHVEILEKGKRDKED